MTTVYILTRSDYDEFEILGVYATQELAEAEMQRRIDAGGRLASYDLDVDPWPVQDS